MKVGDIVIAPALFRGSVVSAVDEDGRVAVDRPAPTLLDPRMWHVAALEWTDTAEGQQCMLPGSVVVRRRPRGGSFVTLELACATHAGLATLTVETRDSEERATLCALLARSDSWRREQEAHLAAFPLPAAGAAGHRRGAL